MIQKFKLFIRWIEAAQVDTFQCFMLFSWAFLTNPRLLAFLFIGHNVAIYLNIDIYNNKRRMNKIWLENKHFLC